MNHLEDCDVNDINPDGIKKPCNCGYEHRDGQSEFEKALTAYGNAMFDCGEHVYPSGDKFRELEESHAKYAILIDRASNAKEAVRAASCVTRISTNSEGKAFAIYLRDGTKITIINPGSHAVPWLEHSKQEEIKPAEVQYGKDPYEA